MREVSAVDRGAVRRSEALGEVAAGFGSGDFGGLATGARTEVAVLEPVAVALEAEDLGVVDETVDHRGGRHVIAEDLAPGNCSWHTFSGRGDARSSALSAVRASP